MIKNNTTVVINEADKVTDQVLNPQHLVQDLFKSYTTSKIDSILKYIKLGMTLLEIKKTLENQFYNVIDEKIMPKKEVTRAMKFVLSIEANKKYREAMQTTNNTLSTVKRLELFEVDTRIKELTDKDLENMPKPSIPSRLKLFELDSRIKDLSDKDLENMIKPSISKFNKMKVLDDDDFKKVLSGNDEPLNAIKSKDEDKYKYKPTEMPDDEYDSFVKAGINPIINAYWEVKKEKESLEKQLEQYKERISKLQNSNMDAV